MALFKLAISRHNNQTNKIFGCQHGLNIVVSFNFKIFSRHRHPSIDQYYQIMIISINTLKKLEEKIKIYFYQNIRLFCHNV